MESNAALARIIGDEIREHGPISFARYMELALYHSRLGYYRARNPFGRRGDFYTAEQMQPVFGETVALFVEKLTNHRETKKPYDVLELGAGNAELMPVLRKWNYRPFDWNSEPLPEVWNGLIFANEFFDALPVHLLRKGSGGWSELNVDERNERFHFTDLPLSDPLLAAFAEEYGSALAEGALLEVNLDAMTWIGRLSSALATGDLVVIDYGYEARELIRFPEGTLISYKNHRSFQDVLSEPGRRDITAHVNFSWLRACAESHGFVFHSSCSMSAWILSVWDEGRLSERWESADARWRLSWKQLMFGMGETFRVYRFNKNER